MVAAAGQGSSPESRRALAELCEAYWYPLYAYVRRRGLPPAEAQDATQSFLAELLENDRLQMASQERGRFRSFLIASLNHFLANQWRAANALKRGGGQKTISLDFAAGEDRYGHEPSHEITAERIFERQWALTLLENAMRRLKQEFDESGRSAQFEALKAHLGADDQRTPYEELARQLNTTAGALRVAAHRLKQRCRELLRAEIADTVNSDDEIDDELRSLFKVVAAD